MEIPSVNAPTEREKLYPVFAHFLNAQEFMWKMNSKNNCGKSFSQSTYLIREQRIKLQEAN